VTKVKKRESVTKEERVGTGGWGKDKEEKREREVEEKMEKTGEREGASNEIRV